MSTPSEQDHLDPSNPIYYAPRSLREGIKFRITRSNDAEPELPKNSVSSPSSFENLLMEAVRKSTDIPLDADGVNEPHRYDNGPGRWMARTRVAWWSAAAAVGGLALVALVFVIIIPASRSHAPDSNVSGAMESLKTALGQAPPEDPSKPANTHQQSEALLHRFLQWQQKLDSADPRLVSGSGGQGESESVK
jgi:hypothetical protein